MIIYPAIDLLDGCYLWIGRFHYGCYEYASVPLVTIPAGKNVTERE